MMNTITPAEIIFLIIIIVWELFWKGIALWRAAKNHQKKWFIALIILIILMFRPQGFFGIVDIIYLFFFAKHKLTVHEMTKWFSKKKE